MEKALEHLLTAFGHYSSDLEKTEGNQRALHELQIAIELLQPKSNSGKPEFVTESEAEELALKHIENYMAECHCQSHSDVRLVTQKMLAMAMALMEKAHIMTEENQH